MSISADARLLRLAAVWAASALAAAGVPALAPLVWAGGGLLLAFVWLDAHWLRAEAPLALERSIPERANVGATVRVELALHNRTARSLDVALHEAVPADLVSAEPRFGHLCVAPGATLRVGYDICPRRRGDRALGVPLALVRSPLGLLRRRSAGSDGERVRVYPDTTHLLRPEALDPRRVLARLGVRPARERGEGMEFESLRDYVPGDDPRRVDWAASARRGRPIVRRHRHERNHTLVVAVDASRLMGGRLADGRTKLDCAIDAALALVYAGLGSGDRVALVAFDDGLRGFLPPRSHRRELGGFIDFVRPLEPRMVEADYEALVRGITARQQQRALVVLLSDFVEVDPAAITRSLGVLAKRHQVLLVALRDPLYAELDPGRRGASEDAYRRIVLDDLLHDRETALLRLRRLGLHTLDLPPAAIVAPVLNRYLAIRYGGV